MLHNTFCRRLAALVLTLAVAVSAVLPVFAVYPMPVQTATETEAVYLFNADTGKTILSQNADQQKYVASLTKLMTALLLVESGKDLNGEVTVPTDLTQEFKDIQNANGTTMGLRIGETVRRIDLLNAMLIISANDAASVIAWDVGGSVVGFVQQMNARAAELLALIGDFERLGDHAMNLLESGEELRDKDISLPAEDRRELRVLTDAVEEIADLALDAFRREDPAAQAEVEALEQVIDGLKEQLRSRRIRRMQQGSGTMELGFVWSDVLTDLERAADHCSNIAGCVAGLPDGNQGLHAAQTALRQQDPAFEDRVRRYAEKYRV